MVSILATKYLLKIGGSVPIYCGDIIDFGYLG